MSTQPLVSVVIPFFNAERFIEDAILSVFAQTYQAWELLLVDDGSTDEGATVARQYAAGHPEKVSYLEHSGHENRGKSASRNLAIERSSGEYVSFLDADDVWLSNILDDQVAILESHPQAAMVYGPLQWWYSWTGEPEDLGRDYVEELGVPPNTLVQPGRLLSLFLQDRAAVPSDTLVRRETIDLVGGFEERFKLMYEDQVFYAKVCLAAPVFAADKCWYRYRQHSESSCARGMITGEYYTSRVPFLDWLAEYFDQQGVEDDTLWQALHEERWRYRHKTAYRLVGKFMTRHEISRGVTQIGKALERVGKAVGRTRGGNGKLC